MDFQITPPRICLGIGLVVFGAGYYIGVTSSDQGTLCVILLLVGFILMIASMVIHLKIEGEKQERRMKSFMHKVDTMPMAKAENAVPENGEGNPETEHMANQPLETVVVNTPVANPTVGNPTVANPTAPPAPRVPITPRATVPPRETVANPTAPPAPRVPITPRATVPPRETAVNPTAPAANPTAPLIEEEKPRPNLSQRLAQGASEKPAEKPAVPISELPSFSGEDDWGIYEEKNIK